MTCPACLDWHYLGDEISGVHCPVCGPADKQPNDPILAPYVEAIREMAKRANSMQFRLNARATDIGRFTQESVAAIKRAELAEADRNAAYSVIRRHMNGWKRDMAHEQWTHPRSAGFSPPLTEPMTSAEVNAIVQADQPEGT